ncbi:hypothetical protein DPMN_006404 [Dreissena polymorpha]|uniref:Uncharacterized protein n=1 Tax=Dreissena polymorpha TaxID=45954 RepID=A0A9D4RVC5_DREPO|nr:hypothetical protein DPMN_006404 [Dreissena polymorpha]
MITRELKPIIRQTERQTDTGIMNNIITKKKRTKEEASPDSVSIQPVKLRILASNTSAPTTPALYDKSPGTGPYFPPHLQFVASQLTPIQNLRNYILTSG